MKKHGKKYRAAVEKLDEGRKYSLDDAVKKLKEIAFAKFDETVELTIWLGVASPRRFNGWPWNATMFKAPFCRSRPKAIWASW